VPAPPAAPEPPKTWTGTAGVGASITSGNSDTMNYNLAFDLTRTPKARNVMKWTGLYLRGDQNDVAVVDRISLGFRDEYTLSGRTFIFGQIDYLRDASRSGFSSRSTCSTRSRTCPRRSDREEGRRVRHGHYCQVLTDRKTHARRTTC